MNTLPKAQSTSGDEPPLPEFQERTCECGVKFQSGVVSFLNRVVATQHHCADCIRKIAIEQEQRDAADKLAHFTALWADICPPLYRETKLEMIPLPDKIKQQVISWTRNAPAVALVGKTGIGKTRLMFKLLERLHFEGEHVMAISAKAFERACSRMFESDITSRETLEKCERARVLFLDDMGKERFTDRVESELYNLIEVRTSNLRPTLWTSNTTSARLKEMLSADRGEPILRRLKEFSAVVSV